MDQSLVTALSVAVPVAVAVVSGYFGWRTTKGKTSVDAQAAIASGFGALVEQLQEERKEANARLRIVEIKLDDLIEHVGKLEDLLRAANIAPPARPRWTAGM